MTKIIGFLGKKQSGKNTACNFILALKLIELGICKNVHINEQGEIEVSDILGQTIPGWDMFPFIHGTITKDDSSYFINTDILFENEFGKYIKIYSLAAPLKKFCIEILGLKPEQVYGTDKQKNSLTHLKWEDMPGVITEKELYEDLDTIMVDKERLLFYHEPGLMTAREVLQYAGTDIIRKMYADCWANYLLNQIDNDSPELALVSDVRFPNETHKIRDNNGIIVYLTRDPYKKKKDKHISEAIIDDSEADIVLDNQKMTIQQQNQALYEALLPYNVLGEIVI
jgi:hypothetical protein